MNILKRFIKNNINVLFLTLFMMSVVNLLFMHYQFLFTIGLEAQVYIPRGPIDNFLACIIDVTAILFVSWIFTFRRLRQALTITFIITLVWSFCNIFYFRFFFQYLSLSAIDQAGNMTDSIVLRSMLEGFRYIDLYFPLISLLFYFLYKHIKHKDVKKNSLKTTAILWLFSLLMVFTIHSFYAVYHKRSLVIELEQTVLTPAKKDTLSPNWTVFHKGSFRKLFASCLTCGSNSRMELTKVHKSEIEKEYLNHSQRLTQRTAQKNVNNIIFILVESYMSALLDLTIDGKEITPNLNRLKQDSTIYYNGHMHSNVSVGRSSDGQLIYMCGLLPLHSEITVSRAKNITLLGLPEIIKDTRPDFHSYTIIPNTPTCWEQQSMSAEYGFDKLYSVLDYKKEIGGIVKGNCLNDNQIFTYASLKDKQNSKPFLSLILTVSTHQPYREHVQCEFEITDSSLPHKYINYLVNCHYADAQIGEYIRSLKESGLYNNSLIIIVSDHEPPLAFMDMEGQLSNDLPLFIINGGFDKMDVWNGECNQLDVFTTILDIMGIKSQWRGLGYTLLNKNYNNSVTQEKQKLSDWIIYGNYFGEIESN